MIFSERIKKEAKKFNMPPQNLLMADLISIGYSEAEAYNAAYPERDIRPVESNMSHRDGIINDGKFKVMLEKRIQRQRSGVTIPQKLAEIDLITKEEALKEILLAAKAMPEKSKERGELFIKYSENLSKLQANDEKGDSVQIYLPLKCTKCQLYADYLEHRAERAEESAKERT